jgi:Tfp pilus assembly protein PilX
VQLQKAQQGERMKFREVRVRAAEAALQSAEATLQKRSIGTRPDDANRERLEVAVEVARLDLARARAAQDQPTVEGLQLQLYDLRKEFLKLRSAVASLSAR